jgi:predicted transcriptional regulator
MVRQTIKRILDELEANSFIKEPKEIKQNGEYFYGYVKTAWKEI